MQAKDSTITNGRQGLLDEVLGGAEETRRFLRALAQVHGVPDEDMDRPDVKEAVRRSALMACQYGYIPGQDLHVAAFLPGVEYGKPARVDADKEDERRKYDMVIGAGAYEKSFQRWRKQNHRQAAVSVRELDADEVREITLRDFPLVEYSPEDRGAAAVLIDVDDKAVHEAVGREYKPREYYGFWRAKAYKVSNGRKEEWVPESVPAQRSALDVAMRRAEKACLMTEIRELPIDDEQPDTRLRRLRLFVEAELDERQREQEPDPVAEAMPASSVGYGLDGVDETGVFAVESPYEALVRERRERKLRALGSPDGDLEF